MAAEFRNLRVDLYLPDRPRPITLSPGETFGVILSWEFRGDETAVWVGIGLAYGLFGGHNPPFCYAMRRANCGPHADWTTYLTYEDWPSGILPLHVQPGKLLDAQRFISDSMPVIGQQPANPWGVNNWDDEVYASLGAVYDFRIGVPTVVAAG